MTWKLFLNYILEMDAELKALEEKIGQFVQLNQRLRAENLQLRQEVAAALSEKKRLDEKIEVAKARLEALLEKIPGGD